MDHFEYATDTARKVNWCLTNCVGKFLLKEPHIVRSPLSFYEKISPPGFIFELDDDAVLFSMMFEGLK